MPKKVKLFAAGVFLALVGVACVVLATTSAKADGSQYGDYEAHDGDGWSMTANGVFTIENDQGWVNCLKNGYKVKVEKLIIGRDVRNFRMYEVSYEAPTSDFYDPSEIVGCDKFGQPYYDYAGGSSLYPRRIEVEAGNPYYKVADGLLINTKTNEIVLSEMSVVDVVIPEGIKGITREAFSERDIQTVQFSTSLETIGERAFSNCADLKSVILPASLMGIKADAFADCKSLQNVSLHSGLLILGDYAFCRCPIQSIEIPETVEEIGAYAFFGCNQLQQVLLPSGLKRINAGTFSLCDQLMRIDFPDALDFIGRQAFCECHSLKRVILPDSLSEIGDRAFWGCDLTVLRIPEKLVFPVYDETKMEYITNSHQKQYKRFDLSSVDTVIFSGSDYDFGYPAVSHAHNVYFLGKPPEDVGQILDENSVESIFCSEEYEHEWTRSTVASWVRQRLTILPTDQMKQITEQELNATPLPTELPRPTPRPTETPWPTPMPRSTASPVATTKAEQQPADPLVFVFAGILALVIAGIVVVAVKSGKPRKRAQKRK
ncbi:MAG: leucine-rich repeat protein [Christensenella sp.]|nr:leucine-rich repeat protein [Christensenella sp.]